MNLVQDPVRILQVGVGNRGRMWAEIITRRRDVDLVGLVDVNPARLAALVEEDDLAGLASLPVFTDLTPALDSVACDAVLLVTPPDGHLAQARAVFAAGLPLLAEKPLTLDLHEAVEIVALADRAGLPLMVGLNFRFLPVSRKLRELVSTNCYGAPGFAQFTYQRNRDGRQPRLNKYPLSMRHPMMLEQSIHHLDLIRFCYGREVEQVVCRTWNPAWSMYAHHSNVSCLLTLEGGLEVNYLGTWTGGWDVLSFEWRTDCHEGVIIQRELFGDLVAARKDEPALKPVHLDPCEPFYDDTDALLSAFVAHLREGVPLACSGADHLRTLALCFAAIESSERAQAIQMQGFHDRYGIC